MYKKGFTLVELLVVIAIISILAATVVPRVSNWIGRARMARAVSEVKNADLAITKLLADASKSDFSHFFVLPANMKSLGQVIGAQYSIYNTIFYELLRRGKDADLSDLGLVLQPTIKNKLGTSYMDIGNDPWGHPYCFYAGPCIGYPGTAHLGSTWLVPWRAHRDPLNGATSYVYNPDTRIYENTKIRGNPPVEDVNGNYAMGYPAAADIPVYIWSMGTNETSDQADFGTYNQATNNNQMVPGSQDGGDDINNWDSESGWSEFY